MSAKNWLDEAVRKDFEKVSPDDFLSSCIGKMEKSGQKAVVVVDGGKPDSYLGIVTERKVGRSLLDPSRTKVRTVMQNVPPISDGAGLSDVAKKMVEMGATLLPVVREGKLQGVIHESYVLDTVARSRLGSMKLKEVMTKAVISVAKQDSIGKALSLMRHFGVTRLPVKEGPRVVAIVTLNDILEKVVRPKIRMERGWGSGKSISLLRDPVSSIMSSPPVTLGPEETISTALKVMTSRGISSVLVINELGELLGIVTKHDALRPLAQYIKADSGLRVQLSLRMPGRSNEFDVKTLRTSLASLTKKFERAFEGADLSVFVKSRREQRKGRNLFHVRIMLSGPMGSYASVGEGWGDDQALRTALNGLERQLMKTKGESKIKEGGHKTLYDVVSLFY